MSSLGKLRVNKTEKKKPAEGPLKLEDIQDVQDVVCPTGDKKEVTRDAVDFETLDDRFRAISAVDTEIKRGESKRYGSFCNRQRFWDAFREEGERGDSN